MRTILNDVTCRFEPGELTVVAGPSGSGKTTLLCVIGCLLTPTEGRVTIGGDEIGSLGDSRKSQLRLRRLGYVFQSFRLFPALNVFQNVEVPLRLQGIGKVEATERVVEALGDVGLESRMNERVSSLSGGEQQRVAIARALVTRPSVVLADEPSAALDGESGRMVFQCLGRLASTGCTVIVVTHDPRMFAFGDRRVTLQDGAVKADEKQR